MTKRSNLSRRRFLGTGVAATGIALAAPQIAHAADYPERNISVIIPTREGGGADRNFRAFTSIWIILAALLPNGSVYVSASGPPKINNDAPA